ncbi:MAG: hypothetical protein ACJ73J_03135 [Actinomycetes bacterium]
MAGFLDKAKQVAQQALDEAKKGVEQGQAKLDEAGAKREATRLLAALGAAFYAEQRADGTRADVDAAMLAVDNHVSVNGTQGFPGQDSVVEPPPGTGSAPASDAPSPPSATGQTAPPDAPRPPGM